MKILIACEESQRVCSAFRAYGHEAYSCDVVMTAGDHPEWHIWSDVTPFLNGNCSFRTCDGQLHQIDRYELGCRPGRKNICLLPGFKGKGSLYEEKWEEVHA